MSNHCPNLVAIELKERLLRHIRCWYPTCSAHFTEDCFEAQSIIAKRLGLEMKTIMKADAVPTIFRSGPPLNKRQRQEEDEYVATESRKAQDKNKLPRGAFRKREAARVGL